MMDIHEHLAIEAKANDRSESFHEAWAAVGADPSYAPDALGELTSFYDDTFRYYHGLTHISHCLSELDTVQHRAEHPEEVELAIWFHDAIYNPARWDNEARSARLAREWLSAAGADPEAVQRVGDLIRATKQHDEGLRGDAAILSDVDLAILGAPTEAFACYEDSVRLEHDFLPDVIFWPLRRWFARKMLARARIFHTPELHQRYERQARENLKDAPSVWRRLFPTFLSLGHRPPDLSDWFKVRFDAQYIHLDVSPPGRDAWTQRIGWNDVSRICFVAESYDASDELHIFTTQRERSHLIPIEAEGGTELWFEILRRDLFPDELAIKAAGSVGGLFCWPPM